MPEQTLQSENIDLQPEVRPAGYYNNPIPNSPAIPTITPNTYEAPTHNPALDIHFNATPSKEKMFEPETFNYEDTNAARYVGTKNYDVLGFDPKLGPLNEEKYAYAQSGLDQFRNAFAGAGTSALTAAWDQFKSYGNTIKAFTDPSLKSLFEQEQLEEINKKNQEFSNNYPIYTSAIDNSIWTKVMQNVQSTGPLIGSMGELVAEQFLTDAAIAATFGGATPLEGIEAIRVAQATKKAENLANTLNSPNMLRKVFTGMGDIASKIPGIGNTLQYGVDLANYGAEGGAMATIGRGIGAFTNDIRGLNLAVSFASSNAASTYQSLLSEEKANYKKLYGIDPDAVTEDDMKTLALKAAKTDGAINSWAMLFTEKMAFGNIMQGNKAITEALQREGADVFSKIGVKPSWAMAEGESPVFLKQNKWLDFKSDYYALPREMTSHGLGFGLQTGSMGVIDKAVKSYYDAKYDNKDIDWVDAMRDGLDKQFTRDGAETFISSFLTGSILLGVGGHLLNKAKESIADKFNAKTNAQYFKTGEDTYQSKEDYTSSRAQAFKEKVDTIWKDPFNPIKDNVHDFVLQTQQQQSGKEAASADDRKTFEDSKDDATRLWTMSAIKNNVLDLYLDRLNNYSKTMTPEELCNAFNIPYTEEAHVELLSQLKSYTNRAKDIKHLYNQVERQLGNPFNPRKFKEGTDEFYREQFRQQTYQHAKDYIIFTKDNVERSLERQSEILNGKDGSTGIKDMPFTKNIDFSTLFSITNTEMLDKELKSTIQMLAATESKSKEHSELNKRRELLEKYQEQLTQYTEKYYDILSKGVSNTREKDIIDLDDKHKDKLTDVLHELLTHNSIMNGNGSIPKTEVRDGIDKFLDYYKLGVEHNQSLKMANLIVDPTLIDRFLESFMTEASARRKAAEPTKEEPITVVPTEPKEETKKDPFATAEDIPFEETKTTTEEPVEVKKGIEILNFDDLTRFGTTTLAITKDGVKLGEKALTVRINDADKSTATVEPINEKLTLKDFDTVREIYKKLGNQLAEKNIQLKQNKNSSQDESSLWRALQKDGYAKIGSDGLHYFIGDVERAANETLTTTVILEEKIIEDEWDASQGVTVDVDSLEPTGYKESTKDYIAGSLTKTMGGAHYDTVGGEDVETKNSAIQRVYKTSASVVLPEETSLFLNVNHVETNNDPYKIVATEYPHDVKLVLTNEDGEPIDSSGIIKDPNKDNLIAPSLRASDSSVSILKGDLLNPNDKELEIAVNHIAEKRRYTREEKELYKQDLIKYRQLVSEIRQGKVKRLMVTGKSQGIPVYSPKVTKVNEKGEKYTAVVRESLLGRVFKDDFDPIAPKHPNGDRITLFVDLDGRPKALRGDGQEFSKIYNRQLFSHEKENVITALKYLSTIDSKHPDYAKLQGLLKTTLFYGTPKTDKLGNIEYKGANRIFVKEDANGKGLYRTEFTFDNGKQLFEANERPMIIDKRISSFNPIDIEANKDIILKGIHHQINDTRLKSNDPYIQYKVTETEDKYTLEPVKTYKNYLEYLIKPRGNSEKEENGQSIDSAPLHTNIIPFTKEGEAQFKNVHFTFEKESSPIDEVKPQTQIGKTNKYGSFTYPENYVTNKDIKTNIQEEINDIEEFEPDQLYTKLIKEFNADLANPILETKTHNLYKLEDANTISIVQEDLLSGKMTVLDSRVKVEPKIEVESSIIPTVENLENSEIINTLAENIISSETSPLNNTEDVPFDLTKSLEQTDTDILNTKPLNSYEDDSSYDNDEC